MKKLLIIIAICFIAITSKGQINYLGENISLVLKDSRYSDMTTGKSKDGFPYLFCENNNIAVAFYMDEFNTIWAIRLLGYPKASMIDYLDKISNDGAIFDGEYWHYHGYEIEVTKTEDNKYMFQYCIDKVKIVENE